MALILRDYQQEAFDKIKKRLREVPHPLLATISVGGGKSLLISSVLSWASSFGIRCLCLTLNSSLIQQNANTHKLQDGNYGVNCAGFKSKATEDFVIFASPNSICQQIRNKQEICTKPFQLIVIDECHQVFFQNSSSMFMRIINHYSMVCQEKQLNFRVLGLTGTPYRGKNISIVGENQLFKEEVCNIDAPYLIERGYLTKPRFGIPDTDSFDFKDVRIQNNGKFNQSDLQASIDKNIRLTGEIMQELQRLQCNGIFIFCSTIKHCYEALKSLPQEQSAVIVGDTPVSEREEILDKARRGEIKYLISVSVLMVGVDVPYFDVCAWLRPTESLIIYVQGIGRVLRLYPGKERALVLDFAGNLERHGDIDHPIINKALQPSEENEKDYVIPCYTCKTLNAVTARRCIGVPDNIRCNHYFVFKPCPDCQTENDIVSRECRSCEKELIDPNAKLKLKPVIKYFQIIRSEYWVMGHRTPNGGFPIINARYFVDEKLNFHECYYTNTNRAKNVTYAKFIRLHIEKPSELYMKMQDYHSMKEALENGVKSPSEIGCVVNNDGTYKLVKKIFS